MKKTVKLLLPAFLAICLCVSLISGATFALFTSQSQINIAVTSGKVNVEASAALIKGYSALPEGGEVGIEPATDGTVTFSNGGVVSIDGNKLTVDRITPGDRIEFSISVENHSTVAIKYQTVVTFNTGDEALYRALNISVIDDDKLTNISSDRSTAVSDWTTVPEAEGTIDPIQVSIALPLTAGNDIQEKEIDLLVGIYAVQANGNDTTNKDVFMVTADNLAGVLGDLHDGDVVLLSEDVACAAPMTVSGAEAALDLGGHNLSLGGELATLEVTGGAHLTLTGDGTVSVKDDVDADYTRGYVNVLGEDGKETVLDVACDVTFEDVTFKEGDSGHAVKGIVAKAVDGGKAVVNVDEGADIWMKSPYGVAIEAQENTEVNICGGTITAEMSANTHEVSGFVGGSFVFAIGQSTAAVRLQEDGSACNFSDGVINVKGCYRAYGIWLNGCQSVLNMTGGTINVESEQKTEADPYYVCGIYASGATAELDISGGTINVNSKFTDTGTYPGQKPETYVAVGILTQSDVLVKFRKGATIIVSKTTSDFNNGIGTYGGSQYPYKALVTEDGPVEDAIKERTHNKEEITEIYDGTVTFN